MADRYEEHKWLKSKAPGESKSKFLTKKRDEVDKRKDLLKAYCNAKDLQPSCCIGMTDEDKFDDLKIPVLHLKSMKWTE